MSLRLKAVLYSTLLVLYGSGLIDWVLHTWFTTDKGLGPEPPVQTIWFLQLHSIVSLWFLILFGYLFHSHVRRAWRAKRKIKSGLLFIIPIGLLILTVPGLFYLSDEKLKAWIVQIHVYIGIMIILPFTLHLLTKPKKNSIVPNSSQDS